MKNIALFITVCIIFTLFSCDLITNSDKVTSKTEEIFTAEAVVGGIKIEVSSDLLKRSPSLYWSLSPDESFYPCINNLESESITIDSLNPEDTYYFKLVNIDGSESNTVSGKPAANTPTDVDPGFYSHLVGAWKCVSTGTRATDDVIDHALVFTEGYDLLRFFPDGKNNYTHFWKKDIESVDRFNIDEYKYSLVGDELTLTISYEAYKGDPSRESANIVYKKLTHPITGFNLYFDSGNLIHPPLVDEGCYYFDSRDSLTNLIPLFELSPNTIVSPIPLIGDYSVEREFKVIGPDVTIIKKILPKVLPVESGNMVFNGSIDNDGLGWNHWIGGSSDAKATFNYSNNEIEVNVTSAASVSNWGEMPWTIAVGPFKEQNFINYKKGNKYRLTFDAWASVPRRVGFGTGEFGVDINGDGNSYTTYFRKDYDLTTSRATYSSEFLMSFPTDIHPNINFEFGHQGGTVYIDNVRLEEIIVDLNEANKTYISFDRDGVFYEQIDYNTFTTPELNLANEPYAAYYSADDAWKIGGGVSSGYTTSFILAFTSDLSSAFGLYHTDSIGTYISMLNGNGTPFYVTVNEPKPWSIGDIITGTFRGKLYNDNGEAIDISNGKFKVRVVNSEGPELIID